jgi:hypothetical protein
LPLFLTRRAHYQLRWHWCSSLFLRKHVNILYLLMLSPFYLFSSKKTQSRVSMPLATSDNEHVGRDFPDKRAIAKVSVTHASCFLKQVLSLNLPAPRASRPSKRRCPSPLATAVRWRKRSLIDDVCTPNAECCVSDEFFTQG